MEIKVLIGPGHWDTKRDEHLRVIDGYNFDDAVNEIISELDPVALELNDMLERELRLDDRTL